MTTPTATIFLPYHALDEVHARGTRAAQPAASAVVPGTLYFVTDESVLERSDGSAWAAYAPSGGGGGAPAAHHVSHEPGGADALVDAAWTDVANVFTADQTIDGDLLVTGTITPLTDAQRDAINALVGDPTGARMLMSSSYVSGLSLRHDEDLGLGRVACGNYTAQTYQPLVCEVESFQVHTGVSPGDRVEHLRVHPGGGVTVGAGTDHDTDPGVGIVRARQGVFDSSQLPSTSAGIILTDPTVPSLVLEERTAPMDARKWRVYGYQQHLVLDGLNDAETATTPPFTFARTGALSLVGDLSAANLYEKNRATPLGHWTPIPFTATDFGANNGATWTIDATAVLANSYTIVGKTLIWNLYVAWFAGTSLIAGAPTALAIQAPITVASENPAIGPIAVCENAGVRLTVYASAGATLTLARTDGAAFAAGVFGFCGQVIYQIP